MSIPLTIPVQLWGAAAPMHVELAPRRREAVTKSDRRVGIADGDGNVRPGHDDGVEGVEVVETNWQYLGVGVRRVSVHM